MILSSSKRKSLCFLIFFTLFFTSNNVNSNFSYQLFNKISFVSFLNLFYYKSFSFPNYLFFISFQTPFDELTTETVKTSKKAKQRLFQVPKIPNFNTEHKKSNPRLKYLPSGYKSIIKYDSVSGMVLVRETIDKEDIGYPYFLDIDDYLEKRQKQIINSLWDSVLNKYDIREALSGGDLARMLSAATGLTIPIPQNPLFSIFGKPEININVSGEVNLRMGLRWDAQNLGTVSAFGQSQFSPMFDQDIRVNVSGGIGDKLRLSTDWNTRSQFDFNNKFKIGYEGEDDEIIRLVEVGNVQLPIPSTLIGGGQALFGVRADFQFGPLFLKTLVSQKRGERKFVDVQGGTSRMPFQIRAYDYVKNHFFIDTAYRSVYREYFKYSTPIIPPEASRLRIKQIEVWESTAEVRDALASEAVCFANLDGKQMKRGEMYDPAMKSAFIQAGEIERGRFMLLDSMRYRIDYNLGTLTILNLRQDRYYAVAYRIENYDLSPDDDIYYGTFSAGVAQKDTLILKLIYRPNMQPGFKTLWQRQMKNIYSINATNVNINDTRIGIWYINQNNDSTDVLQGAPDKLVTIFKVDQVNNNTGNPPPDGQFDLKPPFFNAYYGEITFPSLEPFREGLREYFAKQGTPQIAEMYVYNEIYDTTYDVARRNTARDRFIISGEVSGRSTNRISLGAFNLAQGSVKVTLDGIPLREFEDYVVDYYSGQITLRNPRASLPNANLKIEYEQQDIFNLTTRSMVGVRGDLELIKSRRMNATLGFTAMLYDQSALIDRVRLGDEPVTNSMIGFDARFQWDATWLTNLLNLLPFYNTKAQSSINARGEWALILPNPNKRLSEVASDNNEPVVYIDDFEGAQRYISLGLSPFQWTYSSPPLDSSIAIEDTARSLYRGNIFWFQYHIPRIPIYDIYPKRSIIAGRSNISPLIIQFNPYERGIYNQNPLFLDKFNPNFDSTNVYSHNPDNKKRIWGGMTRLFSSFNTNFDAENIEYIEIMMKIDQYEPGQSKMYIDLGQISEDIIPNKRLNTEDGITPANPMPNNIIDPGEDVGIDEIDTQKEKQVYPYPLNLEDDPARDNYRFDFSKQDNLRNEEDFRFYNNYEGNASVSEMGQFPDTEILNKNNGQTISLDNSYFTYEVNLQPDPISNPQIVGGGSNGWFLYRIPVRKPSSITGNPLYSNIQYIRVWFKGGFTKVSIAEWRLLGSHWQRINNIQSDVSDADSTLSVAFVNVEENSEAPDFYTMPPGVQAPRQLNNPDPNQDIRLNEQSLSIMVRNLRYGEERIAVRFFRQFDAFYYKILKFFIHGDGSMPDNIVKGAIPKAIAIMRFGVDSMNYYEYRVPLVRGWQNIEINLEQLTSIKQLRDSLNITKRQVFPVPNNPLAVFVIKGNPVLTRVQYFGFGIANPAERYPNELTTTMWVDELRLISPERSSDWAGVSSLDIKFADLGTFNASFSHYKPNYHRLEERFGNRITSTNWSITMTGNFEKFAPSSFKEMKIPISFTHAEFLQDPQFVANNDINLLEAERAAYETAIKNGATPEEARKIAEAVRVRSQTVKIQDSWALTGVRLGLPINSWIIKETFNKLNVGYSYSQEFERSPVVAERFNWMWKLNAQYTNSIPELITLKPLSWIGDFPILGTYKDWKINFLPSNISVGMDMVRRRTTEQSRYLEFPSPVFRDFSVQRQGQFSWKISENGLLNPSLDYTVSTGSTLVPYELDEFGKQRSASEITKMILFRDGNLINFGENTIHSQNVTINFKPRLPIGSYTKFIDMTGSFNTLYSWQNPLQPDPKIRDIAKSASWNNSIRLNVGIRLKSMTDDLFGIRDPKLSPQKPTNIDSSSNIFSSIGKILKTIFLDFDKFDINFNQTSSSINPGIIGGNGLTNIWGRGLTFRRGQNIYGPSMAYQLGLVTDPHGGFDILPSNSFPFFKFETYSGLRPPNAILQDLFNQKSTLDIKTSRPLWQGATLDLNWIADIGFNKNQTVITDSIGNPTFTNVIALESYNRTYFSMPSFFGFNLFGNTVEHVIELFENKKANIIGLPIDTITKNQMIMNALSDAFREGLEGFSLFKGELAKYLPAMNWQLRWEGIEKWPLFNNIAKRVSFEHAYTSKYSEIAQITDNGRYVQTQQVTTGFSPLFGITMTFDEKKIGGLLTATLRWTSTNSYQLSVANRATIQRQSSEEIQAQASYTLRGFDFPLLGLMLKNDLEFSFMASFKKNRRATYDILDYQGENGRTLDGNTQITIEPRARYTLSQRITASAFVRYEGTFTEGAASPGFSTTQVGLDLRISIAGGR